MKKYLPHIAFAGITLAIMLPLYQSGFVFLLDMVFTPHLDPGNYLKDGALSASLPITILIELFSFVLPLDIIQKIILSAVLFLPGFLMYKLAKLFLPMKWAALSGIFYMLNPYVYERFLAGHWYVLLGYAFFPLLVKFFLEFLERLNNKNFLKFALLFSVYPILSLHWAYISFWFLILLGAVHLIINKKKLSKNFLKKLAKYFALVIPCFLIINSFWLFNFFSPSGSYYKFSLNDFAAFTTKADPNFGVFFNVLSLYGFWGSDFFLPKDFSPYWWILTLAVLFFSVYGIYKLGFANKLTAGNKIATTLILTLTIAFIPVVLLSVGYGSEITKPLINFLSELLPGFKGLRETEKLVGLLAFSYAVLIPAGGLAYAKKQKYAFPLFLLIPFLAAWTIFWGFSGQLQTSDYPQSWYQANKILKEDQNNKLLFLPWHGYPNVPFANNAIISNPAPKFFQIEVIAGKSIDNVYLLECDQGIWDKKILAMLHGFETLDENIEFLQLQNITHLILAKFPNWERYGFLEESDKLQKIFETDDLVLYKMP